MLDVAVIPAIPLNAFAVVVANVAPDPETPLAPPVPENVVVKSIAV